MAAQYQDTCNQCLHVLPQTKHRLEYKALISTEIVVALETANADTVVACLILKLYWIEVNI
ncbi:hypothetical protein LPA65_15515 (plasmid) [Lactiplantibacillus argentoratensis]|uniref:Uncharacterized protein n=1 Tax=Lactiplantibacillus argentoratensis TaxID=271881 RepID=A0AAN1UJS4_9LACO|nr:hypothetical protein LPA65_15515 [Lactiplantibacillus argentoratensis]